MSGDMTPAEAAAYPGEDDLVEVVTRALWPDLGDRLTATRAVRVVLDEQARLRAATPSAAPASEDLAGESEGVRVAAARWQDAHDLSGALGVATGDLYWHELIERVRTLRIAFGPVRSDDGDLAEAVAHAQAFADALAVGQQFVSLPRRGGEHAVLSVDDLRALLAAPRGEAGDRASLIPSIEDALFTQTPEQHACLDRAVLGGLVHRLLERWARQSLGEKLASGDIAERIERDVVTVRLALGQYYRHGITQNAVDEEFDARALLDALVFARPLGVLAPRGEEPASGDPREGLRPDQVRFSIEVFADSVTVLNAGVGDREQVARHLRWAARCTAPATRDEQPVSGDLAAEQYPGEDRDRLLFLVHHAVAAELGRHNYAWTDPTCSCGGRTDDDTTEDDHPTDEVADAVLVALSGRRPVPVDGDASAER